ncbi:MAG: hypothetical protein MJ209_05285 [archaeon]|nr:hypothetical protein [archaeon]
MDEEFITKERKSFVIRREINGLLIDYGSFFTLADAIAFKEELEEDGWPYRKDQIISGNEKKVDEYGQYITGKGNKFVVSREIAGVNVIFGVFDTLKNAKNFKYTLSENVWCVKFSDNIPKYGKFIIKQGSRYVIKRELMVKQHVLDHMVTLMKL